MAIAKSVTAIPTAATTVDLRTGQQSSQAASWNVMPAPPGHCQICGKRHEPSEPHDAQQLRYKLVFGGMIGREPTWADAIAHCSEEIRETWEGELRRLGAWTEPPAGEVPVRHHGVD